MDEINEAEEFAWQQLERKQAQKEKKVEMNEDIQKLIDVSVALERQQCAHDYLKIMRDAVKKARLEEREACAKLCESMMIDEYATGKVDHNERAWTDHCAAAIRRRTE